MALSAGNSIFVAGALLSDPSDKLGRSAMKYVVSNTGDTGIALLIPLAAPQTRAKTYD